MRYDKQSLCEKDLKQRLDSVPVEIYEKLNIEKKRTNSLYIRGTI